MAGQRVFGGLILNGRPLPVNTKDLSDTLTHCTEKHSRERQQEMQHRESARDAAERQQRRSAATDRFADLFDWVTRRE